MTTAEQIPYQEDAVWRAETRGESGKQHDDANNKRSDCHAQKTRDALIMTGEE